MTNSSEYSTEDVATRRARLLKEADCIKKEAERTGINTQFTYRLYQVAENPDANDEPITNEEIESIWATAEKCGLTHKDSIASICQRVYRIYKETRPRK